MAKPVQALKPDAKRRLRIAGVGGLLLQLVLARMTCHCVDIVAAKKSFHRAVVASGVAGLIAGGERIVNVSFQSKRLTTYGMHYRMAVAPKIGIFGLLAVDFLKRFEG